MVSRPKIRSGGCGSKLVGGFGIEGGLGMGFSRGHSPGNERKRTMGREERPGKRENSNAGEERYMEQPW